MDSLKEITYAIHRVTGINVIQNDSRKSEIVDAKRVYSLLASRRTNESWGNIGEYIGMSHSLMIHHKNKGLDYLETDKSFKKLYNQCIDKIESFKSEPYIKRKIAELETEIIKYKRHLLNIKTND